MSPSRQLDIGEFLDSQRLGRFHWKVLLLCTAILVLDGFDVVAMGFIAPAIVQEWGIAREALGVVMSAGLLGLAIGAMVGGPLADRFGRRKVILGAVVFFGVMSALSAAAPTITMLSVLRFLTGLGLGASQPNAATLMSEYAPRRHRSLMVSVVYCGFTLGAAGGGFLATSVMSIFGWRSILLLGGLLPIICAFVLYYVLPESIKFLAVRDSSRQAMERIINTLQPGAMTAETAWVTSEPRSSPQPAISLILSPLHRFTTLALWVGLFMNLMTVYFLNSWLPIIIKDDGFSLADAALMGALLQVGGTLGNVVVGWEMDRFKPHRVMIGTLLCGAVMTVTLGTHSAGFYPLMALVFVLGFCVNSSNTGWTAMAAGYYPTQMRATGTSWMTGIGRMGAILGAYVGSILLGMNWDFKQLFMILTVPIGIAMIAAYAKGRSPQSPKGDHLEDVGAQET